MINEAKAKAAVEEAQLRGGSDVARKIEKYTTEIALHRERVSRASGPLQRAVLVLHAPYLTSGGDLTCDGCEYSGYDGEPPPYPCATYRLAVEKS